MVRVKVRWKLLMTPTLPCTKQVPSRWARVRVRVKVKESVLSFRKGRSRVGVRYFVVRRCSPRGSSNPFGVRIMATLMKPCSVRIMATLH